MFNASTMEMSLEIRKDVNVLRLRSADLDHSCSRCISCAPRFRQLIQGSASECLRCKLFWIAACKILRYTTTDVKTFVQLSRLPDEDPRTVKLDAKVDFNSAILKVLRSFKSNKISSVDVVDEYCFVLNWLPTLTAKDRSLHREIKLFTELGSPKSSNANIRTHRILRGDRRSRYAPFVSSCLEKCIETHRCQSKRPGPLLTRILDLSEAPNGHIILDTTGQGAEPYTALSHCWGGNLPARTTLENYEAHQHKILITELPRSFQDAIHVTLALGLRYLWIDALCIIQDDINDWEAESQKMASVYGNAHVVIGADSAADSSQGFLDDTSSMNDDRTYSQIARFVDEEVDIYMTESPFHWNPCSLFSKVGHEFEHRWGARAAVSPLSTRAWAFQEQLLARRMLHFTSFEVIWECKAGFSCECTELEESTSGVTSDDWLLSNKRQMYDQWYDAVDVISERRLTHETDRLPCLSGLAALMQENGAGNLLAGLWEDDLILALCWGIQSSSMRLYPPQAPSWSWASLEAPRDLYRLSNNPEGLQRSEDFARIVDVRYSEKKNFCGSASEGSLVINAPIVHVEPERGSERPSNEILLNALYTADSRPAITAQLDVEDIDLYAGSLCVVLMTKFLHEPGDYSEINRDNLNTFGILLQQLHTMDESTFTRIGSFSTGEQPCNWVKSKKILAEFFRDAEMDKILLV